MKVTIESTSNKTFEQYGKIYNTKLGTKYQIIELNTIEDLLPLLKQHHQLIIQNKGHRKTATIGLEIYDDYRE